MTYSVRYRPGVERDMRRLPKTVLRRADAAITAPPDDPRPPGCVKLKGHARLWRIRVGDWRIVYEIDDSGGIVEVTLVAHRR